MESVRRFAAERRKSISALVGGSFDSNKANGEYAIHSSCAFPSSPFVEDRPSIDFSPPSSPTVPLRNNNGRRRFSPHRRFSVTPSLLLRKEKEKEEEKAREKEEEKARRRFSTCE
ncbi:hypothetical protein PRIPAC_85449 [Pristionchus pacificus]|uniref:Uncharacterized protein n=1 Tax=Pristionchus pacificus TaxID=54126 RepID=A0A454XTK6_PRIPA|nr:hypothetical protein PRIPAC_85449 [Pristionchus pacificus]|eukprot:PDM66810.1 hypothetical protein PRIPAC_48227 [Pristionchus pacificus]